MEARELIIKKENEVPVKTRIAAWWMLITSVIAEIIGLVPLVGLFTGLLKIHPDLDSPITFALLLVCAGLFIFYLIPGLLVLKGERRGWIAALVILSIATFGLLILGGYSNPLCILPFLIPLALILLDHISSKRVALLFLILMVITYLSTLIIADILI